MTTSQRGHQRHQIAIPVEVIFEERSIAGMSRNVSLGGMFIVCLETVPFGEIVRLRFELRDLAGPVITTAVVRWIESSSGIGVQFTGLRAREVWALQQLIARTKGTPR